MPKIAADDDARRDALAAKLRSAVASISHQVGMEEERESAGERGGDAEESQLRLTLILCGQNAWLEGHPPIPRLHELLHDKRARATKQVS